MNTDRACSELWMADKEAAASIRIKNRFPLAAVGRALDNIE